MQKFDVSIIGLGRLGLPLCAAVLKNGNSVLGVDIDSSKVNKLNKGQIPFYETGLKESIEENFRNFYASTSSMDAILNSDNSIILVNTPKDASGSFSTVYVEQVFRNLFSDLLESDKKFHRFILSSTVMVGTIEEKILNIAVELGLCRSKFELTYVPDFVAIGKVISDFLNPEFILVASNNKEECVSVDKFLKKILVKNKETPSFFLNYKEGEMAKITLNNYIAMKISFANKIGEICRKIGGVNSRNVLMAVGEDSRIGKKYFRSGGPYGGTCFPRDVTGMKELCKKYNVSRSEISGFCESVNLSVLHEVSTYIDNFLKSGNGNIYICGLSFKPETQTVENSLASKLYEIFTHIKRFYYHDKLVSVFYNEDIRSEEFILSNNSSDDLLVLCNDDVSYSKISESFNGKVLDIWG